MFVPGLSKPGGFTITSTPKQEKGDEGFLELAIQSSPSNPSATWFWQGAPKVARQRILVRVGGSFSWPPPSISVEAIKRIVFIAGGVGVK